VVGSNNCLKKEKQYSFSNHIGYWKVSLPMVNYFRTIDMKNKSCIISVDLGTTQILLSEIFIINDLQTF